MQKDGTVARTASKHQKKIYNLIPYQNRKALVDLVVTEGLSVYRASRVLGIKNTTAKAILRRYRRQGTIFMRKHQKESEERSIVKAQAESQSEIEEKVQQEPVANQRDCIKEEDLTPSAQISNMAVPQSIGLYIYYF